MRPLITALVSCIVVAMALSAPAYGDEDTVEALRALAEPLESPADLDSLVEAIGDRRFVLLGEASHGTAEFYEWRAAISQRLIEEEGFDFIAVEGDWALIQRLNRYVKDLPGAAESAREVLLTFDRWPLWMWANETIVDLAEWLREHNQDLPEDERVGLHGIDVYNMERSLEKALAYLHETDSDVAEAAAEHYDCMAPFAHQPQAYAQALAQGMTPCAEPIAAVMDLFREHGAAWREAEPRAYFEAEQNAFVVKNAERHYRGMVEGPNVAWNTRARHFHQTVERLGEYHGEGARGIVWAHNTHVGDARATDMADDGRENIGQLMRETHGADNVFLLGFSTHRGAVLAGPQWEGPMEEMEAPPGVEGSYEDLLNQLDMEQALLFFAEADAETGPLAARRGHRAIGVVYQPAMEHLGNYVPTVLPARYDALIYIEETRALDALH